MAKKKDDTPPLLWLLALGGAGIGIYLLVRRSQETAAIPADQVAELPPVATPATFSNIQAIQTRLTQLRELYVMGTITPEAALSELSQIETSLLSLISRGLVPSQEGNEAMARAAELKSSVLDYLALREAGTVS